MAIKGIKKVVGESKTLKGCYDAAYLQINYDISKNKVWSDYHYDLGHSWHTYYNDDNILECGNICEPITMKQLENMIQENLAQKIA
jgi:hypothetical protein